MERQDIVPKDEHMAHDCNILYDINNLGEHIAALVCEVSFRGRVKLFFNTYEIYKSQDKYLSEIKSLGSSKIFVLRICKHKYSSWDGKHTPLGSSIEDIEKNIKKYISFQDSVNFVDGWIQIKYESIDSLWRLLAHLLC